MLLWAPQINQCMGNTGDCYKSNGHNLSDNRNNYKKNTHISSEMLPDYQTSYAHWM